MAAGGAAQDGLRPAGDGAGRVALLAAEHKGAPAAQALGFGATPGPGDQAPWLTTPEVVAAAHQVSAVPISARVAFSMSLIGTPPKPRNPPSLAASATRWAVSVSQALNTGASSGALAARSAATCRKVSSERALTSPGVPRASRALTPSRAAARPSAVVKSAATALTKGFEPTSALACTSAP